MKVEFEKIGSGLEILDAVVRDYPVDFSDEGCKEPHFQARVHTRSISADDSFSCSFVDQWGHRSMGSESLI